MLDSRVCKIATKAIVYHYSKCLLLLDKSLAPMLRTRQTCTKLVLCKYVDTLAEGNCRQCSRGLGTNGQASILISSSVKVYTFACVGIHQLNWPSYCVAIFIDDASWVVSIPRPPGPVSLEWLALRLKPSWSGFRAPERPLFIPPPF